ncbi:MAG: hypothetical protein ACFE9Q_05745 [Candidatus Hodarchaeota archaeon]
MVKKGKYKLFGYIIENQLLFYKNLGRNEKIIAFTIIDYHEFKSIHSILNDFLRNKVIQYYAIQMDTQEKSEKLLILNFEDSKKEIIIKSFNFIQQKLIETNEPLKFLKEKNLESKFLSIISQDINSNTSITRLSDSLQISSNNNSKLFNFFLLNLDLIKKRDSFILNFLKLINNLGRKGILICNFKIDNNDNIKLSSFFVEEYELSDKSANLEEIVNNFFQTDLVKKQNVRIRTIFNYIWRLELNDSFYLLNECLDLFLPKIEHNQLAMSEINKKIEQNLLNNQIEYIRLDKTLIFIEQNYLFIILEKLDSKYIIRILKKYYPKYIIYILINNELEYKKLKEAKSLKLIENIKIVHPKDIQNFNYPEFKKINS